jgi:hypothetical protein
VRLHSGLDRIQLLLRMLAGEVIQLPVPATRPVVQTSIFVPGSGRVLSVEIPHELVADPGVVLKVHVTPGIEVAAGRGDCLGWMVLQGQHGEDAEQLLPRAAGFARQMRLIMTRPTS